VTNGKLIRLFVDDEPFDVRYGERRSHERLLDFRAGVLNRGAEWVSSAGKRIRVSSTRLVSFSQRSVAAICYEVEPLTISARFALQSELVTNEKMPGPASADPRAADKPEVRPIQVIPARPRPSQPPGREPVRRPAPEDG
jgi:alpha,alpha-trehalose phosphorylase